MCASGVMATMDDYVSSHFNVKRSFFPENVFFSTKFIPLVSYVLLYLFSVIHVSVDIKTVVSQRKTFSFFFFSLKVQVATQFRAKNVKFHLGCHNCWLSYFTLACLWCRQGRTVTWLPKFLACIGNQMFLPMVLRCVWKSSAIRFMGGHQWN